MYIWVNTLVESSRVATAGDADFRRSRVGRCVGCYISMHLLQYSTCPRPSSMFSSRQSKCSRV
jgi:hypothetical protein